MPLPRFIEKLLPDGHELILKTEGELLARARRFAQLLGVALLVLIGSISLVTPFLMPEYLARWFDWPTGIWSALVPLLLALAVWQFWKGLRDEHPLRPFLAAVVIFVLSFAGLGVSFYPNLIPPRPCRLQPLPRQTNYWRSCSPGGSF